MRKKLRNLRCISLLYDRQETGLVGIRKSDVKFMLNSLYGRFFFFFSKMQGDFYVNLFV